MSPGLDRRAFVAAGLSATACAPRAKSDPPAEIVPLKQAAPFPIGTCVQAAQLDDPAFASLIVEQVSQLTAEWEMKTEYTVLDDGSYRFDRPDKIAEFARAHGMRLFGHTLVWYAESPKAWEPLAPPAFRAALEAYIAAFVGRYRGLAVAWDVVNEAVSEDGDSRRTSLWSEKLGDFEHMRLAYELAHAADPNAVLFLNDYFLDSKPNKRVTFLKLAEDLLKAGAPLTGLGSQTHVNADLPPGAIKAALKDIASLGLKVRVSEMDVSVARARNLMTNDADLVAKQARVYAEAAEAFSSLPAAQRFDFTFWGLKDSQSWLKREQANDTPLLFDDAGRPKPAAAAWEQALKR